MIDNLNLVFMGVNAKGHTMSNLDAEIAKAHKTYLDLVYKRVHYDEFKKKLFTGANLKSLWDALPRTPVYENPTYDSFTFQFDRVPLKFYMGHHIGKLETTPQSSAVYYHTAPVYSFKVTLIKGKAVFENLDNYYKHPHSGIGTGYGPGMFPNICVGRHHFQRTLLEDKISDSTVLTSTLLDMFTWLLEVNLHDNYGTLLCEEYPVPSYLLEDIVLLKWVYEDATQCLINNETYAPDYPLPSWLTKDMSTMVKRNLCYALYLYHCTINRKRNKHLWEFNAITKDIDFYLNYSERYCTYDMEHIYAPVTHKELQSYTGDTFL